jgi:hypothetical protein
LGEYEAQGDLTKIQSPPQRRKVAKKTQRQASDTNLFAFLCENFASLAASRWVFGFDAIALV